MEKSRLADFCLEFIRALLMRHLPALANASVAEPLGWSLPTASTCWAGHYARATEAIPCSHQETILVVDFEERYWQWVEVGNVQQKWPSRYECWHLVPGAMHEKKSGGFCWDSKNDSQSVSRHFFQHLLILKNYRRLRIHTKCCRE